MKLFINICMQKKSLEDTIKLLQQKYKHVPSPLSDSALKFRENIAVTPQQVTPRQDPRNQLISGFRPTPRSF